MIKNKDGVWEKTPREVEHEQRLKQAKVEKGKAQTKAELQARVQELERMLGI